MGDDDKGMFLMMKISQEALVMVIWLMEPPGVTMLRLGSGPGVLLSGGILPPPYIMRTNPIYLIKDSKQSLKHLWSLLKKKNLLI